MLLESPEAYYAAMKKLCDNSQKAIITSFGVFCNLTISGDSSDKSKSIDRDFIDSIANHPDLSIIVGVMGFSPCKDHCIPCGVAYIRRTLRIETHREKWPNLKWHFCQSLHSKVAAFIIDGKYFAIIGSRNFTGSTNKEMAIVVSDQSTAEQLYKYASNLLVESPQVTMDALIENASNNSDPKYFSFL